ncbi:hypothetical protein DFJ73DRAFT_219385 [Zopfochytrium polystomum]|nr:hypothetical protein DFJ73DRAFT_219385 [Zopfochytrium polystomum]
MPQSLAPLATDAILQYLPGPDRFRLATLLRIERHQALALYSLRSASLYEASARGLVDLLEFRLRTATQPIGSTEPLDSLFWILDAAVVRVPAERADLPCRTLRIEWWDWPVFSCSNDYDDFVRRALCVAASHGHVLVLDWWMHRWPRASDLPDLANHPAALTSAIDKAIRSGHISVLEWCRQRRSSFHRVDSDALKFAANANQVDVLEWLEQEVDLPSRWFVELNFGDETLQLAHLRRRREAAETASAHAFTGESNEHGSFHTSAAANQAGSHGHIAVLQWLKDTGCNISVKDVAECAILEGKAIVLNWLRDNFSLDLRSIADWAVETAASEGHVEILQFFWDHGTPAVWDHALLKEADICVFQWWAKRFGSPDTEVAQDIVKHACRGGRKDLLEWLKSTKYIFPLVCPITAAAANPDIFDWWTLNNLPLVYEAGSDSAQFIIDNAARWKIMEWLVDKQNRAGSDRCGVPDSLEWPLPQLVAVASVGWWEHGEILSALEWWKSRGSELGSKQCIPLPYLQQTVMNVPFLEWMLVRRLGPPPEFELVPMVSKTAQRWWVEAEHRTQAGN